METEVAFSADALTCSGGASGTKNKKQRDFIHCK